jgi:hypothetical protein
VSDDTARRGWWLNLPPWARIGLIAFGVVVIALSSLVAFRVATRVPAIATGMTAAADLRPGSCLDEPALDLDEYTVLPCEQPHPQQVFATADLELDDDVYALSGGALEAFGDAVCNRYLEYRLFLAEDLDKGDYRAHAIALPSPDDYAAGSTETRCVIAHEEGDDLVDDLYRPMP